MSKIAQNIADLVGNTPMIKLNNIDKNFPASIYAKCEFMNPTSSVKDRIGLNMLTQAIKDGTINKETHIIEPTSGNTGIALAAHCASMGIQLTLTMPSSMSIERQRLMKIFGASVLLTPAKDGMKGSINMAQELSQENENTIMLSQFSNPNNPKTHEFSTALEILDQMDNKIDILIASVGTGGTISGTGKILKEKLPNIRIIAVEPLSSAVLSGEKASPHQIQGIGAGFIPDTLNTDIYDEIIKVSNEDAIQTAQDLAKKEGLLVGISSGANIWASSFIAKKEENKDKNIVTVLCDTAERYLSTELFDNTLN
ncbi:MAG: cysteine synthase A [Campylobacterota bacterium]|nr:cysteine synthase A [Campylobacterota bacterium]